ncbi:hypothetical protein U9M48_043305 [Paspalum notatum var. saurae]|uniref:Uncharacterized protein n=1 Tax=Paspalum notatum var. saurae TaxID=547442 RepID=A0AAQ3UUP7_PASNO
MSEQAGAGSAAPVAARLASPPSSPLLALACFLDLDHSRGEGVRMEMGWRRALCTSVQRDDGRDAKNAKTKKRRPQDTAVAQPPSLHAAAGGVGFFSAVKSGGRSGPSTPVLRCRTRPQQPAEPATWRRRHPHPCPRPRPPGSTGCRCCRRCRRRPHPDPPPDSCCSRLRSCPPSFVSQSVSSVRLCLFESLFSNDFKYVVIVLYNVSSCGKSGFPHDFGLQQLVLHKSELLGKSVVPWSAHNFFALPMVPAVPATSACELDVCGAFFVSNSDAYLKSQEFNREPLFAKFRLCEPFHKPILSSEPSIWLC